MSVINLSTKSELFIFKVNFYVQSIDVRKILNQTNYIGLII